MTRRLLTIVILSIIFFIIGYLYQIGQYTQQKQINLPDIHLKGDQQ